jgi:DNA replication protein DnaC
MTTTKKPASEVMEKVLWRLRDLKLAVAASVVEDLWDNALRQSQDGLAFLLDLLDRETVEMHARRRQRRFTESKIPKEVKTLEAFDWSFPTSIDKSRILALARLDFLRDLLNIIITGKSGTGKSHIAKALAYLACGQDVRVRYTTCADMLNDLYAGLADHTLERRLRRYQRPELLVIDDLGTEKVEIIHGQGASLFFKVINYRYGTASTIITSNLDRDAWDGYFGDPNVTVAALDRFTQHAIPVAIDGDSYRVHLMEARMAETSSSETQEVHAPARSRKRSGSKA